MWTLPIYAIVGAGCVLVAALIGVAVLWATLARRVSDEAPDVEGEQYGEDDLVFVRSCLESTATVQAKEKPIEYSDAHSDSVPLEGLVTAQTDEIEEIKTPQGDETAEPLREIERLSAALERITYERDKLKKQVTAQDKELDERARLLNDRDARLANQREEMMRQSDEIRRLQGELAGLAGKQAPAADKNEVAELKKELRECEAYTEVLKARADEMADLAGRLKSGIAQALEVLSNTQGATSAEYLLEKIKGVTNDLSRVLYPED